MSTVNPYGSYLLKGLYGNNTNALSVQSANIVDAPTTLKNLATNLILNGEVTSHSDNNHATISTNRGDVQVRVKDSSSLPIGSKVDIQIPAGQENTKQSEALIQPRLAQALKEANTPQDQSSVKQQNNSGSQQPLETAPSSTLSDVKNLQSTVTQATQNSNVTVPTLKIGQTIRLTPLTPSQYQSIVNNSTLLPSTAPLQTLTTSLTLSQPQQSLTLPSTQAIPQSNAPTLSVPLETIKNISQSLSFGSLVGTQANQNASLNGNRVLTPLSFATPLNNVGYSQNITAILTPTHANSHQNLTNTSYTITNTLAPLAHASTLSNMFGQTNIAAQTQHSILGSSQTITSGNTAPLNPIDARITSVTSPDFLIQTTNHQASPLSGALKNSYTLNAPTPNAGQMTAIATGLFTPEGNPIIQFTAGAAPDSSGTFSVLHYPAKNLPAGTRVLLSPLPGNATDFGSTLTTTPQSWKTMVQFIETMAQFAPNTAQSLMPLIPNTTQPKSFPAAALLFLAAAKGGDLSGWLGARTIRTTETPQAVTAKKALESLLNDIANRNGKTASRSDPPMVQNSPDWRGHLLPLMVGADIHQATFWTKDHDHHQQQDSPDSHTMRFVVDLTLSRMGDIYFDGFINKNKHLFDLSLITERKISMGMQDVIKSIWYKTLDGMGMSGNILFKEK